MKRGFITMNEPLPVEIKIFTDEMEKHMLRYFDNLSKNKIDEVKEVLAVNIYRLEELRKLVENEKSIQEAKLKFVELGII